MPFHITLIECVDSFQLSLLRKIDVSKYGNITAKLKWEVFIKEIKKPSKEVWVFIDRESN